MPPTWASHPGAFGLNGLILFRAFRNGPAKADESLLRQAKVLTFPQEDAPDSFQLSEPGRSPRRRLGLFASPVEFLIGACPFNDTIPEGLRGIGLHVVLPPH
jgi:hypothetical protein